MFFSFLVTWDILIDWRPKVSEATSWFTIIIVKQKITRYPPVLIVQSSKIDLQSLSKLIVVASWSWVFFFHRQFPSRFDGNILAFILTNMNQHPINLLRTVNDWKEISIRFHVIMTFLASFVWRLYDMIMTPYFAYVRV